MDLSNSGIDPALLQQIMGLGTVDQRHKLLQLQLDRADQTAAGAPVDYQHGKGTPLLLASLANLISSGVGGYQAGKAQGGLRDLIGQQTAGRTAAANAVLGAKPPDLSSVLTASPDALPGAAADAQGAIRGQRSAGLLSLLSGDPTLAGAGKELVGSADKGTASMLGMPQERIGLAEGQQKVAAGERAARAATSPEAAGAGRQLLASLGITVPDTTPPEAVSALMPVAEKAFAARESASARKAAAEWAQQYKEQARQQRQDTTDEKRWTQFGQELDPTKARGGEMAKVVNSQVQFGKVKQIIDQNPNPNSSQMYEIARAFDRAVSGGVPTEGGTEHLIPKTALGSIKDFEQWVANSPVGRDQQGFIRQLSDSIERETKYGAGLLREWQGKKASRYSDLAGKDQARFLSELSNWGLGPEEFDPKSWAYKGAPAGAPRIDPATLQHYKAQLQPGERLAIDANGKAKALGAGESVPPGFSEVQ